jgi:protein TonB
MRKAALLLPFLLLASGCVTPDLSRRAQANLAELVSDDDYPPSAIRAEEQGTVRFALDVSPDGRVTGCTVLESSGSAALDNSTCRIMQRRARFIPALDRKGRPTTDRVTTRLRWVLPEEPPAEAEQPQAS